MLENETSSKNAGQHAAEKDGPPRAAEGVERVRQALASAPRSLVVTAAAGAGALLLLGVYRLISAPRRRERWLAPPAPPSLFRSMARSALISMVSALASRFASRLALPTPPGAAASRTSNLHG